MKISTLLILISFASFASATPNVNYNKQEKIVQKIIDMIFEKNTTSLETIFASNENLNKGQLVNCVKEASAKIRARGSKHLYASRVSSIDEDGHTLYEIAFFYYFKGKKVFYYKINVSFDHGQSMYKPVDIEFMQMKELSLIDIDVASLQAVSPIARN